MPDKRRKTLVYKVARFSKNVGQGNETLQSLLDLAFKKFPTAADRFEDDRNEISVNPDADVNDEVLKVEDIKSTGKRFINIKRNYRELTGNSGNMTCCTFCSFVPGKTQGILTIDRSAKELDIHQMLPNKQSAEILDHILYFGVIGNHVVLIGSAGLHAQMLEAHLNWLLKDKAQLIEKDQQIYLADHPPLKHAKTMKDTKEITVWAPVHFLQADGREVDKHTTIVQPTGRGWNALTGLFRGILDLPDELKRSEVIDKKSLEVKLSFKFKGSRQKDTLTVLDSLATILRNVDSQIEYVITTNSGLSLTKKDFKLLQEVNIIYDQGMPNLNDVFLRMSGWLRTLITDKRVQEVV